MSIQRAAQLEQSMYFGAQLLQVMPELLSLRFIDPLSYQIVISVDRFNLSAVAVLCMSCLRYSDLSSINLRLYLSGGPVHVKQGKTEATTKLPVLPDSVIRKLSSIDVPSVPFPASYSAVRYSLNNVCPRIVRQLLTDSFSVTHVFRHLRASFIIAEGLDIAYASSLLGHRSNNSVRCYIHDSLIEYFRSFHN